MQVDSLQQEWDNRCQQEEIFWRQKSRVQWSKEGERNTRLFHKSTMKHRAHNRITKLIDSQGKELNTHKEMESILVQHFQSIVEETIADISQFIKNLTKHIPKLVTMEDNYNLNRLEMEEEVNEVIKDMHNEKAPGKSHDTKQIQTHSFMQFGVQNSKVIANRLKPLIPTLVSEEQTRYVEGRRILNNIIQAHEVVHSLKTNKQVGMIIQLDIAKAYDKLRWPYIREILKDYDFDHNWIKWVMALVTIASCSILLNGSPSRTFRPSRGLRQGDPLSPFLFILMMEGLGKMINLTKEEGRIKGLKLMQNGDTLTHQQFVDDTML
eukprot:PITA_25607